METEADRSGRVLILGIGNTLLSDDGFGVHVTEKLRGDFCFSDNVSIRDGGTIGLALLPEIEETDQLIVIDAGELKDAPGAMRVFEGEAMDKHLSASHGSVHEVAMSDLLEAAALMGRTPKDRALVVVQPKSLDWGDAPTESVAAAIPKACKTIASLIEGWRS